MTERRYDEEEVALILRNAIDPARRGPPDASHGLTLAEVKEIAAEVGIDGRVIEAAANALEVRSTRATHPLLGAPMTYQYEQWVEGRVAPEDYPDLVLVIRRVMERHGVVSTDLDQLEWRARSASGGRYVTVKPTDNRTLVRVMGNYRDGALGWFGMAGMMGGLGSLAVLKALGLLATFGLGAAPVILLAGYLPARWLWRSLARAEDRVLTATLQEVTRALEAKREPEAP
ncbi:MAG: hypothetical protein E4G90_01750 [Gemmatimonadales bacterium]|nr:MAG: hypothetical protein E4G90_01750 [Gemmatimonadales bacterium]